MWNCQCNGLSTDKHTLRDLQTAGIGLHFQRKRLWVLEFKGKELCIRKEYGFVFYVQFVTSLWPADRI